MQKVITFLTFTGHAEEAINLYTSLFEQSKVISIERYGPDEGENAGKVKHATFSLNGQVFACIDSPPVHAWTFTPAISLWVNCHSEEEIDRLHLLLGEGGQVFMPLGPYPFAKKFTWLADRYGVSWQLALQEPL